MQALISIVVPGVFGRASREKQRLEAIVKGCMQNHRAQVAFHWINLPSSLQKNAWVLYTQSAISLNLCCSKRYKSI